MTRALIPICLILACALVPSAAQANDVTVANNDDAGAGSLRATVAAANAGDTVVIPAGLGTITLTSGQIPVIKDLTIKGAGQSSTVISGNRTSRIFCVQTPACPTAAGPGPQPSLAVSDLKITAGKVVANSVDGGGGIYIDRGHLTLTRVKMSDNSVSFANKVVAGGGAIYNSRGQTTITDSTIGPNNTITGGPGAIALNGGGAVHVEVGPITVTNSHIDGNKATIDAGGGATINGGGGISVDGGALTVTDSTVDGNAATIIGENGSQNGGAGILAVTNDPVTLTRSSLDDNALAAFDFGSTHDGGGGAHVIIGKIDAARISVRGNSADMSLGDGGTNGGGAGIYSDGSASTVSDSTFASNVLRIDGRTKTIGSGGGAFLAVGGSWDMARTVVGPNNAASIHAETGSSANGGGGIYSAVPSGKLTDSTVAQNALDVDGTGTSSGGGAIFNDGTATLTNATIAGNAVLGAQAGGVRSVTGTVRFESTIIAANTAPGGTNCAASGTAVFATNAHNLESANTCGLVAGDLINANPGLGPLDTYGGPTQTLALTAGSRAIDAGANCPATDQRGVARPKGLACDIGAYEVAAPDVVTGDASGSVNPNLRRTTAFYEFGPTTAYGATTAAQDVGDGSAPVSVARNVPDPAPGTTIHYRLVATNADGTSRGDDATLTTPDPGPASTSAPADAPVADGPPATSAGGGPTTTPFDGVVLKRRVLVAKGRRASVPIFCPVGPCTGQIALRSARVALGTATFSIGDGKTANISVRLTAAAGRLLARKPSLRGLATVTATSHGQTRSATAKVALKRKRRR